MWNWDSKIGGGLVIANHLDQSVRWANQKYWAAVRSYITCYTLRASPAVCFQYVTMQKCFSHPSFGYFLFFQPRTHKNWNWDSKIGGGTSNSKPPGPISMMGQSEILSSSQVISITLFSFLQVHNVALYQPTANAAMMPSQNHFPEPNRHICTVQDDRFYYTLFFSAGAQCCCCAFVPATAKSALMLRAETIFQS
jgi:hypothetical protein